MTSGKPLLEVVRDALLVNAYDMYQEKKDHQRIKSSQYDGVISTNFEHVVFADLAGFVFEANLEMTTGSTYVKYFVRTSDLEDFSFESGKWVSFRQEQKAHNPEWN